MYGSNLTVERFLFHFFGPTSGLCGCFHFEKASSASYAGETSQHKENRSARADIPPLHWSPFPQSAMATDPTALDATAAILLLLPSAVFFGISGKFSFLSFLAGRAFGLVRDRSGSMELSEELLPANGREGRGRSEARHCRMKHPGNWQSGTSDRSKTHKFHTHCSNKINAKKKEGQLQSY